jgi:hypothetical protein
VRKLLLVAAIVALMSMIGVQTAAAAPTGWLNWMNKRTSLCFGPSGGNMTPGTKVIQWPCNFANPDQWWTALPFSDSDHGYYLMRNKKDPNKCLATPNHSALSGTQLIIWTCNPANPDQLWDGSPVGSDESVIINKWSQLAIQGGSVDGTWGAPIVQWYITGYDIQKWF